MDRFVPRDDRSGLMDSSHSRHGERSVAIHPLIPPYPSWRAQRGHPFLLLVCHFAARDDKQRKAMTVNCLGCHANEPQGLFYRFPVRQSPAKR